jgi:hypothetical protein
MGEEEGTGVVGAETTAAVEGVGAGVGGSLGFSFCIIPWPQASRLRSCDAGGLAGALTGVVGGFTTVLSFSGA